jgi:arylsulfatase A-like enzyme
MNYRNLTFALSLVLPLWVQAQAPAEPKPNVLFLVVDDLAEYVGFMNEHPQTITPNMDRLARRGTVFLNAHSSSPQCAPSRASFLSGKLPDYTGIHDAPAYFRPDFRSNFAGLPVYTMMEILKDSANYYTYGVRKIFHTRNHSATRDADLDETTTDDCARAKSWSRYDNITGPDVEPVPSETFGWGEYSWGAYDDALEPNSADARGTTQAINFLQAYASNPGDFCDRPFFLALGLFQPHIPTFAPRKYYSEFYQPDPYQLPYRIPYNVPANAFPPNGFVMGQIPLEGPTDYDNMPYIGQQAGNGQNNAEDLLFEQYPFDLDPTPVVDASLSAAERDKILADSYRANHIIAYMASVRYTDAQIGRMLDALESIPGMAENTIIVLLSDHGYALGEKKHWGKLALWDQVTRIPMVIVDPRRPGGNKSMRPVSLLDIFPTIMELTGTPEPILPDGSRYLDGKSIAYLMDNPDAPQTKPVLVSSKLSGSFEDGNCFPMHSVFDQRFHYIRYRTNSAENGGPCDPATSRFQEELYEIGMNREVDPFEFNNLADDPRYQSIKDYLAQFLPGGALFNQAGGQVEIVKDELDCILNLAAGSTLKSRYTAPSGTVHTGAADGLLYTWSSPAFFGDQNGDTLRLDLSTVDQSLIGADGLLPVYLEVRDTVSGLFFRSMELINVSTGALPPSNFSTSLPEPNAVAVSLLSNAGAPRFRVWDYGDGYTSSEDQPAPHRYTQPGTYTLSHKVFYGNNPDNLCSRRSEVVLTIDTAAFAGSPCPEPLYLSAPGVASNLAQLQWGPVFRASGYQFRVRSVDDPNAAWFVDNRPSNDARLKGLQPNQEYEYEVRALCSGLATDTSAWSYPYRFQTPTCFAPIGVAIDSVTSTTVAVSWQAHNPGITAHEVFTRPVGGGPVRKANSTTGSATLTGLLPGVNYELAVRPRCPAISGGAGQPGPLSDFRFFSTPPLRMGQALPGIHLMPNPTAQHVQIEMPDAGGQLLITDMLGRNVWNQQNCEQQARIDVQSWAEGIYLVEWESASGEGRSQKLMIQR